MDECKNRPVDINVNDIIDIKELNALIDFQRKNNPKLKGLSSADIAEGSGIATSTYKALLAGSTIPRLDTIVRLLRFIGGGSLDRLVRFAPRRDFAQEQAVYDKNLVETYEARLEAKRERIIEYERKVTELETELTRVRKIVLEKGEACSRAEARAEMIAASFAEEKAEYIAENERLDKDNGKLKKIIVIMGVAFVVILIAIAAYLGWEIANPGAGNFEFRG